MTVSRYSPLMQWLKNLASVLVHPRITMRRILDAPPDRMVWPLVLLATISSFIGDINISEMSKVYSGLDPKMKIIGPLIPVAVILVTGILFYVSGWIAYGLGRAMEGTGTVAAVRSALAWGLAPVVWALLYRIPKMWMKPAVELAQAEIGDFKVAIDAGRLASGCGTVMLFGILDLLVVVGWVVITSHTLAEAHNFSAARGFGIVAAVLVAPIVIALAAFLAF